MSTLQETSEVAAESSLGGLLAELAALRESAPALVYGQEVLSYRELQSRVLALAGGLAANGIGPGDRVALWLPNVPAYVILCFALARLGAVTVALNTRFRSLEVEDILGRSGTKALVLWPGFKDIDFGGILEQIEPEKLKTLRTVIAYDEDEGEVPYSMLGRSVLRYAELEVAESTPAEYGTADSPSNIFTTSGTTRAPKFTLHRQGAIARHARETARAFRFDAPHSVTLQALPLCGVFGFCQTLAALAGGGTIVVQPLFDPEVAARSIPAHDVSHMIGTDDMFARLLRVASEPKPFPSLQVCGFAAFSPNVDSFLADCDRRGIPMAGLFGMSEVLALYAVQRFDDPVERRGAAGGYPVSPDAEVRVRNPGTGTIAPPGEHGELEFKGPSLMLGYDGNPEATAAAFTEDGFLRSGDIGYLRDDGSFVFEVRMGDVLRLAGFLVSPGEIEAFIERHPSVASAQVVGVESPQGSRAFAFVISRAGAAIDEDNLRLHCRQGMANYKIPIRFLALDEFPVTFSANATKIQRTKLRQMAQQIVDVE